MRVKKNKKVVKKKRSTKQIAKKVQIIGHEPIKLSWEEMLESCFPKLQHNQSTEYCKCCGARIIKNVNIKSCFNK